MSITVHHLDHSRSQRLLWLLEELGLPYEVKLYARDPQTAFAPAALRQVHPLGKSPVIEDGGIVVAETGAIVEHLVERAGGVLRPPAGSDERRRWTYWLHFPEGSAMPLQVMAFLFNRICSGPTAPEQQALARELTDGVVRGYLQPNITRQLDFIEQELAARPWFAGDAFSAADVVMSFPLEAAAAAGATTAHPAIGAFLARIRERPAYQRALERGGPFAVRR